jgi:FkbM family methyltransferase
MSNMPDITNTFYAQFGEDRLLAQLFADKRDGACVEVGANDGVTGSNTLFFEQLGWRCVLVEPNPDLAALLRSTRSAHVFECAASRAEGRAVLQLAEGGPLAHAVSAIGDDKHARAHGFQSRPVEVRTRTLDAILDEAGFSPGFEFLTLDVEGHEFEALGGMTLGHWRPRLVIVEDNTRFGDARVRQHLARSGYARVRRTGVNDWYAHRTETRLVGGGRRLRYAASMLNARALMAKQRLAGRMVRVAALRSAVRTARRLLGIKRRG